MNHPSGRCLVSSFSAIDVLVPPSIRLPILRQCISAGLCRFRRMCRKQKTPFIAHFKVFPLSGGAFRLGGIPSPARGVDCHLEGGLFLLLGMQCQLHGKACHLAGKRCQVVGKGFQVMDLSCFWGSKKVEIL